MASSAAIPDLLIRVSGIASILRASAAESERDRRLSALAVDAMKAAGLYRLCRPKALGGLEADALTALRVLEEVSRIDAAAGWNLQICCGGYCFGAWLPEEGGLDLGREPNAIVAGAVAPPGRAIPVEGGYRVTGRWPFASGCNHADWLLGAAFIFDGDEPRKGENGVPLLLLLAFPASELQIVDTWHTLGMRGTGSHDIAAADVFVPERHAGIWKPLAQRPPAFAGPLYRLSVWFPVAALATPALGTARAAIDALIELSGKKTPAYTRSPLAQRPVVQTQIAQAEALLGAARAYFYQVLGEAWTTVADGEPLSMRQKMDVQLATSHAIKSAADIATLVHQAAGTTGIRNEQPFERFFRDAHTITQHAFGSAARFESVGKLLLGQETDWAFFAL
jgi:alkylation response protein AidB-like acyl-CoA dehydrogenase